MIAKTAEPHLKGTAMGVYSSSQFLGAFCGGVAGGSLLGAYGVDGVFGFAAIGLLFWTYLLITMRNPKYLGTFMVNVGDVDEERARQLVNEMTHITGVAEVVVIPEDGVAYLKVDNQALDKNELLRYSVQDTMEPDAASSSENVSGDTVADR